MLTNFSYIRPKSLKEAMKQLSAPGARLHAGGTDLLGCLRDHVFDAKTVVSIRGLEDLQGIKKATDGGLRIGALATISEVAADPVVKMNYPALAQAALSVASPQLRNQGTIGGNLCQKPRCWYYRGEFLCLRKGGEKCFAAAGENQYHCILGGGPCYIVHPSDTAAALVAYEATLHIIGPKGSRVVPVEKFHVLPKTDVHRETVLEPEEIVTEISCPLPGKFGAPTARYGRALPGISPSRAWPWSFTSTTAWSRACGRCWPLPRPSPGVPWKSRTRSSATGWSPRSSPGPPRRQ